MVIALQSSNFEMDQQQQATGYPYPLAASFSNMTTTQHHGQQHLQQHQLQQQQQQQQQQQLPLHFLLPLLQSQNPLANVGHSTSGNTSASSPATQFQPYERNFNEFYANANNNNNYTNTTTVSNARLGQITLGTSSQAGNPASNLPSTLAQQGARGIPFKLALQQQQHQQEQEAIFQQLYNSQQAAQLPALPQQQSYLRHTGSTSAATSNTGSEQRGYPQVNNALYYNRPEQSSTASNNNTTSVSNYTNYDNTVFSTLAGSLYPQFDYTNAASTSSSAPSINQLVQQQQKEPQKLKEETAKTSPAKSSAPVTRPPVVPLMQVTEYSLSLKTRSACDECSRTKVKCSGTPICTRCSKRGLTCTFSQTKKRGPKNKKAGYYFNQISIPAPAKKQYIKPLSSPKSPPPSSFYQEFKN